MNILKYIWKKWRQFGMMIGSVISFVLLLVLYVVVLAPFGAIMAYQHTKARKKSADSYWVSHDTELDKLYEQQF